MKRSTLYFLLALGALALLSGGAIVYTKTRGLRNNNPGNIRKVPGTVWQGQTPEQTDDAFVQFMSAEYGIRALTRVLNNYAARGLNTVADIINTYAPPSENDSSAYVNAVAQQLNVAPDATIDVTAYLPSLIAAIVHHENGVQPYAFATIERGIALA
jgi:hypothetical protein